VKTLIFLSKDNNSVSSYDERSCAINIVLFCTLRSNVAHFVSHSTSIVVLDFLRASVFAWQMPC
jgi:hypothetical protein